jgi:hypothetical protein
MPAEPTAYHERGGRTGLPPWPALLTLTRIVVALPLLAGSLALAFVPAAIRAFALTGLPDGVRGFLVGAEIAASVLFILPRTVYVGGLGLIAVLVAAMGLHAALHLGVGLQPIFLLLVAALLGAERAVRARAAAPPGAGSAGDSR